MTRFGIQIEPQFGFTYTEVADLAKEAERLGFTALWASDHLFFDAHSERRNCLDTWTLITALAPVTTRLRLGTLVTCNSYRLPSILAKMAASVDHLSNGRLEFGIGAGWKEDEWRGYGYGFPTLRERMAALGDHLEIISRMFAPGRATYSGQYASVKGAVNEPKGLQQPRMPIVVGGNGPNVTFRYAARFADELNLVFLDPDEVAETLPVIRQRCEEEDRDPASLKVSLYCRDGDVREPGAARVDLVGRLRDLGLSRLVAFPTRYGPEREVQAAFAADCVAAGIALTPAGPALAAG